MPRPHKRKNLRLGAQETVRPSKLNPTIDSVGPSSPTLPYHFGPPSGSEWAVCSAHTGRSWLSVTTHRTYVAVHPYTYQHAGPLTQHVGGPSRGLFG
ncbi:hypothetical protein YC2023_019578 [Brassica napus]